MRYIWPFAAILFLTVNVAGPALAHSTMSKSVPAEGSTIKTGLAEITLGFTQSVRVMLVKVRNRRLKVDVKTDMKPAAKYAATYSFPVEPLGPGDHSVAWTAVAKDGHVMKGTLRFLVSE